MHALLVGCGNMAGGWVSAIQRNPLLHDRVQITALVDPNAAAHTAFAQAHGLTDLPAFADIETALHHANADAVFDVTPPDVRSKIVSGALDAGLHVLSEKPMANSMEEARLLAKHARAANRIFSVVQNRRYKPSPRRIADFLKARPLGDVTGIHADFFLGPHFGGFREEMDNVLLLDMAIHHFDTARFLTGQTAIQVQCLETNPAGSWYANGASAFATFQMTGGIVFSYRGSWCSEGVPTDWDAAWRITGTKGSLVWDGADRIEARVATGGPAFLRETDVVPVPKLSDDRQTQEHASAIAAFVDAVESGTPPETDSSDNLHSIAMVFAAIQSARTGHTALIEQDGA